MKFSEKCTVEENDEKWKVLGVSWNKIKLIKLPCTQSSQAKTNFHNSIRKDFVEQ